LEPTLISLGIAPYQLPGISTTNESLSMETWRHRNFANWFRWNTRSDNTFRERFGNDGACCHECAPPDSDPGKHDGVATQPHVGADYYRVWNVRGARVDGVCIVITYRHPGTDTGVGPDRYFRSARYVGAVVHEDTFANVKRTATEGGNDDGFVTPIDQNPVVDSHCAGIKDSHGAEQSDFVADDNSFTPS
jgi:hypothetical protein